MFQVRVKGLEHLHELPKIFASLDGIQFRFHRNGSGEIDMESSMREMEREIDRKLQSFSHNPLAKQFGDSAKQQLRQKFFELADRARRGARSFGPLSFNPRHI